MLQKIYARYKSQGLVMIGVHSDPGSAQMRKAVKDEKIVWPVAQDGKAATLSAYAGTGFPTFVLIDRKGRVRMNDLENDQVEKAVAYLIKEKG